MGLRVVLIGQAAFGSEVLSGILCDGHEIAAVYCPPDDGARPDPLKEKAASLHLPIMQPATFKAAAVKRDFSRHDADLGVLAYVTQIVPVQIIATPRCGSICFHPSLLPRHRGGSAVNWTLIQGDHETGVTVFWPDAGIDTGPVLLQKRVRVDPGDSAGSLYYKKLFPLGVEAMVESVRLVAEGGAPRLVQDEREASYEPLCRDQHAAISWDRPAADVHDLIRGCDPRPGAYVALAAGKLRLFGSSVTDCPEGSGPGQIVDLSEGGMLVKTARAGVRIKQARREGGAKENAAAAARALNLGVGAFLRPAG